MDDEFFKERRMLPADYSRQANKRIRKKHRLHRCRLRSHAPSLRRSAPHAFQARAAEARCQGMRQKGQATLLYGG